MSAVKFPDISKYGGQVVTPLTTEATSDVTINSQC